MEPRQIEKILGDAAASPSVSRDDVRRWVVTEKHRASRRRTLTAAMVLVFVLSLVGLRALIVAEVDQIRQTVGQQPSWTVRQLEEVTSEWCHEPPADYFVQQLTVRHSMDRISSLRNF